ncbi:sodium:solute symporter family protein [Polycladomyces subterraneus]|uniref:Sodium:solute symporter n=1 Tax=Polycladomyces subterraneus TaxID=1016997 RepID=A0ABT8ILK5_9BACL|nr:sodium:solute symporter [Polycladomyces subterraneus]MDN4593069.1 sodium:solute symporter [Polycladomyces subterraneus]
MNVALIVIFAFLLISIYLGIRAKKGKTMNFEQWTTGGRSFGTVFVFLLSVGEIYTTFTFLGASGWAYGKGAPALYILAYGCIAFIISYWLLPPIWRYAKENRLVSQSDYFVYKYNSPALGILVSIVGIVAMIPYFVLQLKGLGIIVSQASYGSISPNLAIWIGAISITVFVMISGVHGSAWTSVLKDIIILVVVVFLGLYLPIHYYGSFTQMFHAIDAAHPELLTLPDKGMSVYWFISTILLTSLGFYTWPHGFTAIYTAKNERVFRRNAVVFPLYQLVLLFVFFVGFAAILQVPGLQGATEDLALLKISKLAFPPWFVGVIGAAGLLAALVPGSLLLMATATLISKNLYKVFRPRATDGQIAKLATYLVPIIALVSLYFTSNGGQTIVALLLMGYSFVIQFFPSLFFSLFRHNPVTWAGAFYGILVGEIVVVYMTVTNTSIGSMMPFLPQAVKDLNPGIVALIVNIVVMFIVSLLTRNVRVSRHGTASVT